MGNSHRRFAKVAWLPPTVVAAVLVLSGDLVMRGEAGHIRLENGTVIPGIPVDVPGLSPETANRNNSGPVPQTPIFMVDDGMRRYFVARRNVPRDPDAVILEDELSSFVTYTLPPPLRGRQTHTPASVGEFAEVGDFDKHGRRYVTLSTLRGDEQILQAITEIRPDYVKITSTSHDWDYAIATSSIPRETLREIIGELIDEDDPDDCMGLVHFYIQAELYSEARQELDDIAVRFAQFSDIQSRALEALELLNESNAERGLYEIQRRRLAGQHQLAYTVGSLYLENEVPPDLNRQAEEIVDEYDNALESREQVFMLLDQLQAAASDQFADRLPAMRDVVLDELYVENIGRLNPFLLTAEDESLSADERLSLAYSGWLLGAASATTDMATTVSLWDARFLALEYIRQNSNPIRREEIIEEFKQLEEFDHDLLMLMIPQLPLAIESPPFPTGVATQIDVLDMRGQPIANYMVTLPPEYSPQHSYPLLVVLRSEGRTPEQTVNFWAGTADQPGFAQRYGYIVVSPEYASAAEGSYAYGPAAHDAVIESIQDARKRFRVDSDRVFLAGHGMGGTACFDLGMSHPDLFAGVVPINGFCEKICRPYYENSPHMAWYVVNGEKYQGGVTRNAEVINDMLRHGHDLIYCEYKNRGFESYADEFPRIFEWMDRFRRDPWQKELSLDILRPTDNQFYWIEADGFSADRFPTIDWDAEQPVLSRAREITAEVTPGNTVRVDHPGTRTTVWLAPQLIDFSERVIVRANREQIFNGMLEPSIEATLEDLRIRGDRQMLFAVRIESD